MAVLDRLACFRVERFHEVRILEDMQAVPARAFGGDDAGIAYPVPVIDRRPAPGVRNRLPVAAPEMAEDEAERNRQAFLPGGFGQMADIVAEADQHRCPKPRHGFDLLLGRHVAPRAGGNQQRVGEMRHRLADIVAAVHRAEAVNGMDDIVVAQPHEAIGAGQQQILDFAVLGSVEQGLRDAGRAGGRVEYGEGIVGVAPVETPERRGRGHARHQVVLGEGGNPRQIVEARNIARLQTRRGPSVPVERNLPGARHDTGEAALLERPQRIAGKRRRPFEKGPAHRVVPEHGPHIEPAEQAAHGRQSAMSRLSATQTPSCPCT